MKLSTIFDFNNVQFDKNNEVILMTSVKAPKLTQENERPPLNLSLVLDVSTSMREMGKIENLKKSVIKFIEQMSDKDIVGIVTFSSFVDEVFHSAKMIPENKAKAISAIQALLPSGMTNMSGGMLKGFEQLRTQDCPPGTLQRILVFTDGQANMGLITKEQFVDMVNTNIKNSTFTISCFGYGTDHSEDILKNITDTGKGNFYYIGDVTEIAKTFARELGGLLSCYAQNISITLEMKKDSGEFIEVLNDLTVESTDNKKIKVIFDDIYSEEERHLLVKVNLNQVTKAVTQRESTVVTGQIHFNDLSNKGILKHENFKAKIKFVKEDEVQKDPTIKVLEQLTIVELAKAHLKARAAADRGDYVSAKACYATAGTYTSTLCNSGSNLGMVLNDHIIETSGNIGIGTYNPSMSLNLANCARGMSAGRSYGTSTDMFSNSVQNDMINKFQDSSDNANIDIDKDGSVSISTSQSVNVSADHIYLDPNLAVTGTPNIQNISGGSDLLSGVSFNELLGGTLNSVSSSISNTYLNQNITESKKNSLNKKRSQ